MKRFPSVDQISEICLKKFQTLPNTGKPTNNEWTVLSCIVQHNNDTNESKVIALGTGTKSISQSKLCFDGSILNDSHAETLARRAFLRYIYDQLFLDDKGIFSLDIATSRFRLEDCITFHFFSTEIPCGDACIGFHKDVQILPKKRAKYSTKSELANAFDFAPPVFTGAKLLNADGDPMRQVEGVIRNKPGRGERTLSISCSDKLSKWAFLGIQGALLDSVLVTPIYLKTLNFGCVINLKSMERAIYKRWESKVFSNARFTLQMPEIRALNRNEFAFKRSNNKSPSPNGLVWSQLCTQYRPYEISVKGKRQGVTSKTFKSKEAALQISKRMLMEKYCMLIKSLPTLLEQFRLKYDEIPLATYSLLKANAIEYQTAWNILKESVFLEWSQKPRNILEFSLNGSVRNNIIKES